jgi:toxin-antitoxin system PIN domain toxin
VILPDVNVLIYAFRSDTTQHALCKQWLDGIIAADAHFGISPLTLSAVARITTNPRIFRQPSSLEDVFSYSDNLLNQPLCEIMTPGERHWSIFKDICVSTGTRAARIADAWFAALAIEHGCTWITFDRDYARFPKLKWQSPNL